MLRCPFHFCFRIVDDSFCYFLLVFSDIEEKTVLLWAAIFVLATVFFGKLTSRLGVSNGRSPIPHQALQELEGDTSAATQNPGCVLFTGDEQLPSLIWGLVHPTL